MKALIVMHHPEEGPGLLKDLVKEGGWEVDEVRLWNGDSLPDPVPFHFLILMGGPMSVNDDNLSRDTPVRQELYAALSRFDSAHDRNKEGEILRSRGKKQ